MNRFTYYRKRKQMSQKDAAACFGVSQGAISQWESGETSPSAKLLPKIAELYNCTVDDLLRKPEETESEECA